LELTFGKFRLQDNLELFKVIKGKVLILCACQVGANKQIMQQLKRVSGARAVIAYRKSVYDTYTNLAEALLYDQLLSADTSPQEAVKRVYQALKVIRTKPCEERYKGNVMVCY
jgi:hypothetical protein